MSTPMNHPKCWLDPQYHAKAHARSAMLKTLASSLVLRGGTSYHSERGETLSLLVRRLEAARVPYTLQAFPGRGYELQVPNPADYTK